jgi:hypothetical protein
VHEEGAIGLEHQEPHGFREPGGQAAGVEDFATGDEEAHRADRTVPFGQEGSCPITLSMAPLIVVGEYGAIRLERSVAAMFSST